jgi:hypothetical protein
LMHTSLKASPSLTLSCSRMERLSSTPRISQTFEVPRKSRGGGIGLKRTIAGNCYTLTNASRKIS